ncbi:unnamed protein product, partial [Prunus brigantina]
EFDLTNERFLVPEMIFHPADLGLSYILVSNILLWFMLARGYYFCKLLLDSCRLAVSVEYDTVWHKQIDK